MRSFLTTFFTLASLSVVIAQDLGVPLSWRKFGTNHTLSERISISKSAIDLMISKALKESQGPGEFDGLGFWQSGTTYTALANHDRYAGTTTYKTTVINKLNAVWNANGFYKYDYNDDAMWYATACYAAYRAYGDTTMRSHADAIWTKVSNYVITSSVASSGKISTKNFTVKGTCDSKSMVGGVFWRTAAGDTNINTITTSLYATLSAYLATSSSDSKYVNAAKQSFTWLRDVNTFSNYLLRDTVQGNDCTRSPDSWVFTYNSGKTVEGLTMMQTLTGDSSWTTYMTNIVAAATKSGPWQGSDGIITEGADTSSDNDGNIFKSIFIRSLAEVYERSSNTALTTLVHSYIDVQFNALLDIATYNGMYSNAWAQSYPGTTFFAWGQASALDVMASAIKAN